MNYTIFRLIMWVCSPVVALMSIFCRAAKVSFPVWILFRSKYKAAFIIAQSAHETAIWKSDLYKRANNAFGMKPSSKKQYQDGVSGAYASYKHVWKSVYDYWDLVTKRLPVPALQQVPSVSYKKDSDANNMYVKAVSYGLKTNGFYGAPYDSYTAAVWLHTQSIGSLMWLPLLVVVLTSLLPIGAYFIVRRIGGSHGFKFKGKKKY